MTPAQREQVRLYQTRAAERARKARLTRATPTGPRSDEVNGQVPEARSGKNPNSAVGPAHVQYQTPERGKWISNGNGSERFVPDENWQPRVLEEPLEPESSVPQIVISPRPWRNTPSGPVQD